MKINDETNRVVFAGENALGERGTLEVYYDNRGEPYRQGITLNLERDEHLFTTVFLTKREAQQLAALIQHLFPAKPQPKATE